MSQLYKFHTTLANVDNMWTLSSIPTYFGLSLDISESTH